MIEKPNRSRLDNLTIEEWFEDTATGLDDDAIAFGHLLGGARQEFRLTGSDVDEFVRLGIAFLAKRGAIPVALTHPDIQLIEYGVTPEEIANNIVTDWVKRGRFDPGLGWIWFVRPLQTN